MFSYILNWGEYTSGYLQIETLVQHEMPPDMLLVNLSVMSSVSDLL